MTQLEQRFFESVPKRLDGIERTLAKMADGIDRLIELLITINSKDNDRERESEGVD